ncbi:MAG: 2,3-bisphosphoglycerate-dependent phosphoglycerate mutase [Actinomycetota bacterium]|jgi:broad specificity phosphatase PhoE|nr:2,3-bisphosphoglycerate-dependent phosphoglycerate mutase [Actinomycetota bacterium]
MPQRPQLPLPRRLWLVRHAESEGNLADREALRQEADRLALSHRDADMPLSDTGRRQAAALGAHWRTWSPDQRPTVVVTSPYERAERTARIALEEATWDIQLVRDERLRERELGVLDGYTKHGIESHFPDEATRRAWVGKFYYRPPGGESWADVAGRVRAFLLSARLDCGGERVVVVSHQAVILLFRYVLEDLTERQILEIDRGSRLANTAVTSYVGDGSALRLEAFNDTAHLHEQEEPVTNEPDAATVAR